MHEKPEEQKRQKELVRSVPEVQKLKKFFSDIDVQVISAAFKNNSPKDAVYRAKKKEKKKTSQRL